MEQQTPVLSYTVRESARARKVTLKIIPGLGLEVVIPKGFNHGSIPEIIARKREWIDETFARMNREYPRRDLAALPSLIHLTSVNREYSVRYADVRGERLELTYHREGSELESVVELRGDLSGVDRCHGLLRQWLKAMGHRHLTPWIGKVAADMGLSFKKVQIRGQKSRWGSCSGRGSISLNCKLLFLPPELVAYIFVHELCHTVHMNHSADFWKFVAKFQPSYRELDKAMNSSGKYVPFWAHGDYS